MKSRQKILLFVFALCLLAGLLWRGFFAWKVWQGQTLETSWLAGWRGSQLVRRHCAGCHQVPDPAEYGRSDWNYILAYMGLFLGINDNDRLEHPAEQKQLKNRAGLLAAQKKIPGAPALSPEDWRLVRSWFLGRAGKKDQTQPAGGDQTGRNKTSTQWKWRQPWPNLRDPAVTLVKIGRHQGQEIAWLGTGWEPALWRLGGGNAPDSQKWISLPGPPVALAGSMNARLVIIGDLLGRDWDRPTGEIGFLNLAATTPQEFRPIPGKRARPLKWIPIGNIIIEENPGGAFGPVNGKDKSQYSPGPAGTGWYLVATFGLLGQGKLEAVYIQNETIRARRSIWERTGIVDIQPVPEAGEKNGEPVQRFLVAVADAREEVALLSVKPGRGPVEVPELIQARTLKSFTPGWGMVSLRPWPEPTEERVSHWLMVNGDNADAGPFNPAKDYQGLRVWRLDLTRPVSPRWEEEVFLPLPGAYFALPADFNRDGQLEILAGSYYPAAGLPARPVYYSRDPVSGEGAADRNPWSFHGEYVPTPAGRFTVAALWDWDQDGDLDVLTGVSNLPLMRRVKTGPGKGGARPRVFPEIISTVAVLENQTGVSGLKD